MRGTLQDIHATGTGRMQAEAGFQAWCSWMMHSRPEPMKTLARRIRRHWRDILAYVDHRCTNAILEGLNGIIQHVKTRARGLRDMDYFGLDVEVAERFFQDARLVVHVRVIAHLFFCNGRQQRQGRRDIAVGGHFLLQAGVDRRFS